MARQCKFILSLDPSQNGKVDVVQDLVDRGASFTSRSKDGWTPLHVASQNGKIDVVKYLLEKGAAIDSRANFGRTPLHLASLFGHLNVVQYLFDRGSAVDATDADGQTPLDLASENGQLDVLKYLLKKGATVDNIKDAGSNAVHIASLNGHLNIVNFFLDNGVTVDKTGTSGQTALHFASSNGHLNIVKYLIGKGASVNSRDNNGQTPLHLASKNGFLDVINYLLDNDAAIDLTDNVYGWTLLHFAVKSRCEEIVLLFLERGCNENRKTKSGQTVRDICDDKKFICLLDKFDMIRRCFGKDMVPNLAKNPTTVPFLADSTLYATMRSIQLNPFIFEKHKNDARILAVLDALDKTTTLDVGQTKQGVDGQMTTGHSDGIYSIQSAVEVISQTIRNIRDNSSAIAQCAKFILSMSLNFQTNRERILATAIMVGRIVNRMVQREIATQDPSILKVLDDIRNYFQTTIETQQPWKLFVHDARRQVIIQEMIKTIVRLQDRLLKATQYLNIQINIQVVGNIYDVRLGMRNMIETMHGLNKCLEYIANFPSLRQQTDKLQELVIQMKRGLEHYSRQVEVGNIARNKEFESQVKKCHDQIEDTAKLMSQKNKTRYVLKKSNLGCYRQTTFISIPIILTLHWDGEGLPRYSEEYSPDLEKLIVKEVKAWKDVSHEPYILTLIGVCTKISTPILVCELCKTNIRRYVRDWPDALIPMIINLLVA
ncbi:hypothetical protein AeMF1_012292 [Aphanomyces euteiches]|nr:hypothetical protein AeMF1_012292 [Aphanomyces euteiches]